jgi:DNA-binding GntR family transcriptional regulator
MTGGKRRVAPRAARLKAEEDSLPAKKGGAPLYMQIASTLRTAIVRGIYPVGCRIPTENELCARFEVSRYTIRDALKQLRADGLITSRQGGRPIVVPPSALKSVRLFSSEMGKDFYDYTMGTRLEISSMEMASGINKSLAAQFDVAQGQEWLRVCGYRRPSEHEAMVCWNDYLIKAEYAAVGRLLARHVGPILPLIEDLFSQKIVKVRQTMSAIAMPADQAATFQVAVNSPALRILTRCQTADDAIAMVSMSLHPGGDIGYAITLSDRSHRRGEL